MHRRDLSLEIAPIEASDIVLVIDACQSALAVEGTGFKPGPLGSRGLGQLAYDKKMRILAATQSQDVALEAGSVGHGLLSYALGVEAFQAGNADAGQDGKLSMEEWLRYGVARVPALTDAIVTGDFESRGVTRVRLRSPVRLVAQTPRLFDFSYGSTPIFLDQE